MLIKAKIKGNFEDNIHTEASLQGTSILKEMEMLIGVANYKFLSHSVQG